jgi:uncharacterized protein YbgA (DUF1722 family)
VRPWTGETGRSFTGRSPITTGGASPLIVPLTLLRHYVGKLDHLRDQVYHYPPPKELMLLNDV